MKWVYAFCSGSRFADYDVYNRIQWLDASYSVQLILGYKRIYITDSTELSRTSEAASRSATEEFHILLNAKVHYRVHKSSHQSLS
jgi:hypothetical protein